MSAWRLVVRIDDADEIGAHEATELVKAVLRPGFGEVGTITVTEWLWEEHERVPKPRSLRGPV